jgi:hypothetical protein
MNNSHRTRRSREYPGGHTKNRRLDRISASAASTLLVASWEQLTDIFTLLNVEGIGPYTQPRPVKERQASHLAPTASSEQGSTSVCQV